MPAELTFPIDALLEELGFVRVASKQRARVALMEAGLTNARKHNMAVGKRDAAIAAIEERIARVCSAEACRNAIDASAPPGASLPRRIVEVASEGCEVCGGSDTTRALEQMVQDLVRTKRTKLLILGGSPNARITIRDAMRGTPVEVEFVEGDRATGTKRALALAERSDVIVIWANTQLSHKVSIPFATAAPEKTITVARRSVSALASEVSRHVQSRGPQRGTARAAARGR